MQMCANRFNTYLLLAALLAGAGCQTAESEKKKEISTFRVHLSMPSNSAQPGQTVSVFRENPLFLTVEPRPFLTEMQVASAAVLDVMGGYVLQVQFDRRGMWLLEQYTVANKGRHLAIFSQFGTTADESRWLAAPAIQKGIGDGSLVFTPDASREEAERIVHGLLNFARDKQKKGM